MGHQPSMINAIGDRVKAGEKFAPGKGHWDIIGDYYVQFRPVHPSHYRGLVNFARWFYDDDEASFPMLQCFYPDMTGKFPWEPGCEQWAIDQQPQLDKPKAAPDNNKVSDHPITRSPDCCDHKVVSPNLQVVHTGESGATSLPVVSWFIQEN